MDDIFTQAFIIGVLATAIRIATPLIFGAVGEFVAESAGILNLSIEGTMTMGALVGFVVAGETHSLWLGIGGAIAAGAMMGLLMAFMSATVKVDQIVAGLALNLFAGGLSFFLFRTIFSDTTSTEIPSVGVFKVPHFPGLSDIPWVGEIFFSQQWLTYIAFLSVPLVWLFLHRTRYGLELRSVGHNPSACDMRGVSVQRKQYTATIFGGMMAGLGGGFLTLSTTGLWFPELISGRGWIALAIVILGNWRITWILAGAVFFGFLDGLQLSLQAIGFDLPYQLLLALPFLLTIVALVINRSRSNVPLSLAIPYRRGQR
ncbi:MAG: ABC transporter permease [Acidimicrobiia bacterium]|nr:ABC transporter permease [Acidimicrobiia bacterium]